MPLKKSAKKSVMGKNISEMMRSSTFAKGKSPEKKQQMAVAAAYSVKRAASKKKK